MAQHTQNNNDDKGKSEDKTPTPNSGEHKETFGEWIEHNPLTVFGFITLVPLFNLISNLIVNGWS